MRGQQRVGVSGLRHPLGGMAEAGTRGRVPSVPEAGDTSGLSEFELHVRHISKMNELLLVSKNADYGSSNIADTPGGALIGIAVRLHDKISRLNNLLDKNTEPNHESIWDTVTDIVGYGLIGQMVLSGYWPGVPEPEPQVHESAFRKQYAPTPSFPGPAEPLPFDYDSIGEEMGG